MINRRFPIIGLCLGLGVLPAFFGLRDPVMAHAETIVVSFEIVNDDQTIVPATLETPGVVAAPEVIMRDNVRLDGWYADEQLANAFSFDTVVNASMTLYAAWDYLIDEDGKAVLTQSEPGAYFESGALTLTLELYEPLRADVTFEWQLKRETGGDWFKIAGATSRSYAPIRNGLHGYRVVYRTPIYDGDTVIDTVRHESASIWIEVHGEFPWLPLVVSIVFLLMFGLVYFLSYKWPIRLYVDGVLYQHLHFRQHEDISDLPRPEKDGFRFDGWHIDKPDGALFAPGRMPRRPLNLHGSFVKQDGQDKSQN